MATALSAIVRTFVLHLTLGRGDGGYDLNLLFPSRNQQPPFPKGEEKTDSEPEDMHNDDDFWTGLGKNNATPGVSARRDRDGTTDDSPMDVGVGVSTAQPGDSAELPTPNPFYQGPHSKDLALVLEVVPDVLPEHALELIEQRHLLYGDLVVEVVVQGLLDHPSYPKAKIDFASVDRPQPTGRNYRTSALNQLSVDFPYISESRIRNTLDSNNGLYAPTHIQLSAKKKSGALHSMVKAVRAKIPAGKGKERETKDSDFDEERAWLLLRGAAVRVAGGSLRYQAPEDTGTSLADLIVSPEEESGFECGCCFSPAPFHDMIQCPEGHIFCMECMGDYASTLLGEHNFKIVCMDQCGCNQPFPESELKRFLTPKLQSLYWRVRQAKEVEMAALDGLEECPNCEFKAVMDNQSESLFRCLNTECMVVTCRDCKKPDHRPHSCIDVDEDKKIDAYHVVEEAMTNALLRDCPKCKKRFIKDHGCNSMYCTNCYTTSCYVCRRQISGHGHFTESTCQLYDDVNERHRKEVGDAQKKAVAESGSNVQTWVKMHFASPTP